MSFLRVLFTRQQGRSIRQGWKVAYSIPMYDICGKYKKDRFKREIDHFLSCEQSLTNVELKIVD